MKEQEEQLHDDLEVEISDLDEAKTAEELPGAHFPGRTWRFARQYKRPVSLATIAVVVLAGLLIFFNTASIRQFFTRALPASPTTGQTTSYYQLVGNQPWGHLFVDGHVVRVSSTDATVLFSLTPGRHTLVWRADPFLPQQCVIVEPQGAGIDTCLHPQLPPQASYPVRYISFPDNLDVLPAQLRASLIQAAQAALDSLQSSDIVQAGELYARTGGTSASNHKSCTLLQVAALCYATARQPLRATLRFQLDTDTSRNAPCVTCAGGAGNQDCRLFCDNFLFPMPDPTVSQTVWQVDAEVHLFWQFATLDGQVIAVNQADTFMPGQQNDFQLQLNIKWNGHKWNVIPGSSSAYPFFSDPACEAALNDLDTLTFADSEQDGQYVSNDTLQGATSAPGCLIESTLQPIPKVEPTPSSTQPQVVDVMQRFGVLLAVNSAAHDLWPFLPLADAYEKQLAQLWIAASH
jgi:hypothetical protein